MIKGTEKVLLIQEQLSKNRIIINSDKKGKIKGVFRNRYWSFKIKQKVFVLHLLKDGGGVCISERTRLGSFELQVDVSVAVWCMEILQKILLVDDNKPFFRKYRGSNSLLLAERYFNWKGVFLKFSKLINDSLKNIIIPGGRAKWGWTRMAVCLDNLVGKRFWGSKGGFRKGVNYGDRLFIKARMQYTSFGNMSKRNAVRGSLAGSHSVKVPKRSWRDAVLIMRNSVSSSWKAIEHSLARELNTHNVVNRPSYHLEH